MMNHSKAALLVAYLSLIAITPSVLAYTEITADKARDLIGSTPDLVIVDVRGSSQYRGDVGHIPGAQNYPWYSGVLEARYDEVPIYKPILVISSNYIQGLLAVEFLDSKGFSTVYFMQEGMSAWQWETEHYSGGRGTTDDPYQIATAEDLLALGPGSYKYCILTRDIDLDPNLPGGQIFDQGYVVSSFAGTFDGNGHVIANATISTGWSVSVDSAGFFSSIDESLQVINLGVINVSVNGEDVSPCGGLTAYNWGSVSNCYCTGVIRGGSRVGGLVGENWGELVGCWSRVIVIGDLDAIGGLVGDNIGVVKNCHSYSTVSGGHVVGGLVGFTSGGEFAGGPVGNRLGKVINCFTECNVSGQGKIGGLVGDLAGAEALVIGCYSSGTVSGQSMYIGGLVGVVRELACVSDSYSMCIVDGETSVGGLIGQFGAGEDVTGGIVTHCYSCGDVKGDDKVGGLVGWGTLPLWSISECFWDIEASGQTASFYGTGLTTAEMQNINTYLEAGWDFIEENKNGYDDIWQMPASGGYPALSLLSDGRSEQLIGQGTLQDPYLISSSAQLLAVNLNSSACFKLTATIDLSDISLSDSLIPEFSGSLDGNGYAIWGLRILGESNLGLFGTILPSAQINNLGVLDASVTGTTSIGILTGENLGGNVTACYSTGSVAGEKNVGGLVGYNRGHLAKCYSLTNSIAALQIAGGLVGTNDGEVEESYSTGDVSGTTLVGGLVGNNSGSIINCYAHGDVTGSNMVGGLAGKNDNTVSYCYSCGSVSADDNVGGLIGYGFGDVHFSYWDKQASKQTHSAGGSGGNTVQMMSAAFYLGWEEDGKWNIDEGKDYPKLSWEETSGEPLSSASLFGGGSGTVDDPYRISTVCHFYDIEDDEQSWRHHFILMADINLAEHEKRSVLIIAPQENRPFQGSFNGNGHTIINFKLESTNNSKSVGLFGYVGSAGRITNLGLLDVQIRADDTVGALAGTNNGSISSCYATGAILGDDEIGGLIGFNDGTVAGCYSMVDVTGDDEVGGFVGDNRGAIADCYSGGNVLGDERVGGLIGINNSSARVDRCCSYGLVTGDRATGGLLGLSYAPVSLCYWDMETTTQISSAAGIGLTTIEMMCSVTYAGWYVSDTWKIDEGNDYPRLVWENTPGDRIEMAFQGSGTPGDPYLIRTTSEFYHFTDLVYRDKHLRLVVDVDLDPDMPNGRVFADAVIPEFSATFDGNHHVIRNLTITTDGRGIGYFGLFGKLAGAEIRDLGVEDAQIIVTNGQSVGGLAGYIVDSSVSNCHCSGSFTIIWNKTSYGGSVGGLAGRIKNCSVSNCYSSGTVSGGWSVGGLIGTGISDCAVNGCYSSVEVSGTDDYAGGLLGEVRSTIVSNCYSSGSVSGKNRVGGLIGDVFSSMVIYCYSSGAVSGIGPIGGLASGSYGGTITKCFWDRQTSGLAWSRGGTGKTTAEMMSASTFLDAGWDFTGERTNGTADIWWVFEGQDYPQLWWEEGAPRRR